MKIYTKLTAVLLALCMAVLLCATASASDSRQWPRYNGDITGEQKYKEYFVNALDIDDEDIARVNYTYLWDNAASDESTPDYAVAHITYGYVAWANCSDLVGNYVLYSNCINSPYCVGYYLYSFNEDKIYSLRDAYDSGNFELDELLAKIGWQIGDINADGVINIKDATLIQKAAAGLEDITELNKFPAAFYDTDNKIWGFSDYNRDGERNIKDATAIQKYLAGLE